MRSENQYYELIECLKQQLDLNMFRQEYYKPLLENMTLQQLLKLNDNILMLNKLRDSRFDDTIIKYRIERALQNALEGADSL